MFNNLNKKGNIMNEKITNAVVTTEDWGEVLKDIRKIGGLSQNKLANVLDCNQTDIAKAESGKHFPRLDKLELWLRANNCTLEIYGNDEVGNKVNVLTIDPQKSKSKKIEKISEESLAYSK